MLEIPLTDLLFNTAPERQVDAICAWWNSFPENRRCDHIAIYEQTERGLLSCSTDAPYYGIAKRILNPKTSARWINFVVEFRSTIVDDGVTVAVDCVGVPVLSTIGPTDVFWHWSNLDLRDAISKMQLNQVLPEAKQPWV